MQNPPSLTNCRHCGGMVSKRAAQCPHCGDNLSATTLRPTLTNSASNVPKAWINRKTTIAFTVGILLIVVALGSFRSVSRFISAPRTSLAAVPMLGKTKTKEQFRKELKPFFDLLNEPLNDKEKSFAARRRWTEGDSAESYEVM